MGLVQELSSIVGAAEGQCRGGYIGDYYSDTQGRKASSPPCMFDCVQQQASTSSTRGTDSLYSIPPNYPSNPYSRFPKPPMVGMDGSASGPGARNEPDQLKLHFPILGGPSLYYIIVKCMILYYRSLYFTIVYYSIQGREPS